ncbi:MAG: ABC transporter ATP-binding protein [bacterium]|nr:ABC transporter ATP-binding protein [bacterium]
MADFLEIEDVSRHFRNIRAVDHVSLTVRKGEFYSLLGPSGCGKTTLLRMLAGFERPDTGRIRLDGRDITDLPPHKRTVNTIFQNYALLPHLTVRQNIAFGLQVQKKMPRKEIDEAVDRMLSLVQLESQADKKPGLLSGGQKQRVAVGRALILQPQVLLLDEPLAALDLKLRQKMLMELDLIHDQVGITFIYVTHDQGEAMSLSDRIAVMNNGRIEQVGKPAEIYEAPRSSFVAAFIGDTNFFEGQVLELVGDEYSRLNISGFADLVCFNDKKISAGNPVFLSIRPEKFHIGRNRPELSPKHNIVRGRVEDIIYLGGMTKYWVQAEGHKISITRQHSRFFLDEEPIRWNDDVWVWWHADDGFMLERYSEADENLVSLPPDASGTAETAQ